MSCLILVIASLLALAVPASIARTSLVGAYLLILVFAAVAAGLVLARDRRRGRTGAAPSSRGLLLRIGVAAVLYAVVVTVVHGTG